MKSKDFSLEIKALSDEGTFEGYGSIFGNTDSYGEKVMPGAFVKSLAQHKAAGTNVLMLWNHDRDSPIGVWEDLAEDAKGLWGKGRLLLDIQRAKEVHTLMKHKAIGGLSIGYKEIKVTPAEGKEARKLEELSLYEISPVTFPANKRARITGVKGTIEEMLADGELPSIKEFEDLLRDAGFSKSMATRIASVGYAKAIRSDSEGDQSELIQFLSALKG